MSRLDCEEGVRGKNREVKMNKWFFLIFLIFTGCATGYYSGRVLEKGEMKTGAEISGGYYMFPGNATKLKYLSIEEDEGAFYSKNIITLISLMYGLPGRKEVIFRLLLYGMEAGLKQTLWHNTRFYLSTKPVFLYSPLFFHTPFAVSFSSRQNSMTKTMGFISKVNMH